LDLRVMTLAWLLHLLLLCPLVLPIAQL